MVASPVFWILVAMGVTSVFIFFARLFELRRAQVDWQDFLKGVFNVLDRGSDEEALAICDDTSAPVARVVETAIRNRHASSRVLREAVDTQGRVESGRLDRRLAGLAIVGQVAPLLGLLGTIIGLVKVVTCVDSAELVSRVELMGSAMSSLVTAAAGLAVAILVAVMYGVLRTRFERIVLELEAAASRVLAYLAASNAAARESSK